MTQERTQGTTRRWLRREVLGTLAAGATLTLAGRARAGLPRIGIVGAGMAGVALAWLLDGEYEVVLFEASAQIGGNVQSVELEVDAEPYVVDVGAQFFHPGPYPAYVELLGQLGLFPPASGAARTFPASITVAAPGELTPRFVSPLLPTRAWPLLAAWNQPAVAAFAKVFQTAKLREQLNAPWGLTLGEWLPSLGLSQAQWEGVVLPWAASLFSGDIEQARTLSARAAMIFAAKALPDNPLDPLEYYVLESGMIEALERMATSFTTVSVLTSTPVTGVTRQVAGGFVLHSGVPDIAVDQLVLASSGPPTLALLAGISGTQAQQTALQGIEFHNARLMLHTDPAYSPGASAFRSFLNCEVTGGFSEASMWLADVLPQAGPTPPNLWKSWVTHRTHLPSNVLHEVVFKHMLPTPESLRAQTRLLARQGQGHLWFAGGFTAPYDSQETALVSAMNIASGLGVASHRVRALQAAL